MSWQYHMIFGGAKNGSNKVYPADPDHENIVGVVVEDLTAPDSTGCFLKEEMISKAGLHPYAAEKLKWEFIRRNLDEEYGIKLVALAQNFFSRHAIKEEVDGKWVVVKHGPVREQLEAANVKAEETGDWSDCMILSGRAIAGGNGKKTVGYACFQLSTSGIVLARLAQDASVRKGIRGSNHRTAVAAAKAGVQGLPETATKIEAKP